MTYEDWYNEHAKKHKKIVDKLLEKNYTKEQIIDYFTFENMVKMENDFCPLYKENKKCHDIEHLNCYMCACPNFRFNDDGLDTYNEFVILSKCNINNGSKLSYDGKIHQDCSNCTVPHHKPFISKNFDVNWKKTMKESKVNLD